MVCLAVTALYTATEAALPTAHGFGAGASAQERAATETPSDVEEVYAFRSLQESVATTQTAFCRVEAPFSTTTETYYSLWSLAVDDRTGRLTGARLARIGELRTCIGAHPDGRVRLYTVGRINGIPFRGEGDQQAEQQTTVINSRVNRFVLDQLPPPMLPACCRPTQFARRPRTSPVIRNRR